jgi:integral membrane protein
VPSGASSAHSLRRAAGADTLGRVLSNSVGRLRLVGMLEGASFLLLLGVAMPLKYLAGMPLAVRIVGSAHGALFVAYMIVLALAARERRWGLDRVISLGAASFLPFGPFFADRVLAREQQLIELARAQGGHEAKSS